MPRVVSVVKTVGKRSILCNFSPSEPQSVPLVFQSAGGLSVNAPRPVGGVMVQAKSEVLGCFKQTSSVAVETVRKLQFWLSHRTDMPVSLLSGMVLPDVAGWAAHKRLESHVSEVVCCAVAGEGAPPPPPQLANSVVRASKIQVQKVGGMQLSVNWVCGPQLWAMSFVGGQASPECVHCLPFAKSSGGPAHRSRSSGRSLAIIPI